MSRSIALLSGKGGSGKTTFALALANMLSSCKIKVLLVDCDIITNGATYFYEDRLSGDIPVASFFELLYSKDDKVISPMEIVPSYYYFIPSIRNIAKDITDSHPFDPKVKQGFQELYSMWKSDYDVILFDCSAGYSDVLTYVLPEADINLVVLESDKVSMAAMRSLYLKLGSILHKAKFYQIFNKVRPEEVEEYQRREGTFFTSIGAIAFDWSIRDAFAVASVPTLDNAGIDFGMQMSSICNTLFEGNAFQKRLSRFGLTLALKKAEIDQEKTRKDLIEYRTDGKSSKYKIKVLATVAVMLSCVAIVGYLSLSGFKYETIPAPEVFELVALVSLLATSLPLISDGALSNRERKMKLKAYDDTLKSQKERIEKLEMMIDEMGR